MSRDDYDKEIDRYVDAGEARFGNAEEVLIITEAYVRSQGDHDAGEYVANARKRLHARKAARNKGGGAGCVIILLAIIAIGWDAWTDRASAPQTVAVVVDEDLGAFEDEANGVVSPAPTAAPTLKKEAAPLPAQMPETDDLDKLSILISSLPSDLLPLSTLSEYLERGNEYARNGEYDRALADFYSAIELDPSYGTSYNNFCWWGSVWNRAEAVMGVCETAVFLEPDNGWFHDSRGVARALSGDYEGAISDFAFYVNWVRENGKSDYYVAEREFWIAGLQAGNNPFDAETLKRLRSE